MKKQSILLFSALIMGLLVATSCSSDDSSDGDGDNNGDINSVCTTIFDQPAQGTIYGKEFTNQGGTYRETFDQYFCRLYVSKVTGGDCAFPEFGGNESVLLFSLPNLNPQTLMLSDIVGEGEILNLNSQSLGVTNVDPAVCGKIEILSRTSTTVTGRLIANWEDGSTINGNFTLTLCTE